MKIKRDSKGRGRRKQVKEGVGQSSGDEHDQNV